MDYENLIDARGPLGYIATKLMGRDCREGTSMKDEALIFGDPAKDLTYAELTAGNGLPGESRSGDVDLAGRQNQDMEISA